MQLLNLIILLATIIPTSYTLKCFQCSSAEVPECDDIKANDTSSPFLQECTGAYENNMPFCRKIVTKVLAGKHIRITRKCGWVLDEARERIDFCKQSDSDFVMKKSCACFSDSCNSSSYNSPNLFIFSLLTAILLIIYNKLS